MSLSTRERWVLAMGVVLLGFLTVQLVNAWRERTRQGALKQTLRQFAMAQESFRYDHRVYGIDLAQFAARGFEPAPDQRIEIVEATGSGWSAIAEHRRSGARCYVFVREAAPVGPARQDGVIECL